MSITDDDLVLSNVVLQICQWGLTFCSALIPKNVGLIYDLLNTILKHMEFFQHFWQLLLNLEKTVTVTILYLKKNVHVVLASHVTNITAVKKTKHILV